MLAPIILDHMVYVLVQYVCAVIVYNTDTDIEAWNITSYFTPSGMSTY